MSAARAVAVIALGELRRTANDRVFLFFIVVLPVVIMVIIGSTFSGQGAIEVGVLDRDGSERSAALVDALDRAGGVDLERYRSIDTLRRDVRSGMLGAGLVVPSGYAEDVDRAEGATVELVVDPTSTSAAAARPVVEAALADEAVRAGAARFVAERGDGDLPGAQAATDRLAADLPQATTRTVAVDGEDTGNEDLGFFAYTAPANLVLFVFVNTMMVGAQIARDRRQGVVRRMLTTPHGTGTILAGIGASRLLFALVQSALLVTVGALLFGVDWGDPPAAALVVVVFALVATAVGVLVGSLVSEAEQAQAAGLPIAIGMGMLGGCMWPLDIVPDAMRIAGHVAPHAWAMDAWIALVLEGEGLAAIVPELAVLAGFAVVVGVVAAHRLRVTVTG